VHGCFLAHQRAWAAIQQAGRPAALVLESDVTVGAAPLGELKERLAALVSDVRSSSGPRYISVGHCGRNCMHAYFINVKAADLGTKVDFCSIPDRRHRGVDIMLHERMCGREHVRCSWERGLPGVAPPPHSFGEGLFFQDRKLHGMHGNDQRQTHIRDGELRETLLLGTRIES
jgi:hypothetical protein